FIKRFLAWRLARRHRQAMQSVFARPLDEDLVRVLEHDGRLAAWDPEDVDELRDLHEALFRLSPVEREVVEQIYWRERSTAEIASEIGMTQRGVNQARRRAEERLRSVLRGERLPARAGRHRRLPARTTNGEAR